MTTKPDSIKIVCVGDSITGWNGEDKDEASKTSLTYPYFLQEFVQKRVFNGGFAGEYSSQGVIRVKDYLALFPESESFVVGYGSNDLGVQDDLEAVTNRFIKNLEIIRSEIHKNKKKLIFLNVPYVNTCSLSQEIVDECNRRRDFCNKRLREYCLERKVALADICSVLKRNHFIDSIHPNEEGAKIIAGIVYNQLKSI